MSINTSFHARLLAAAFLLSGLCCNTALAQPYDPVTMDPVVLDPAFPAQLAPLTIMSSGSTMNGRAYYAQGKGPHPTVLLMHGLPGNELNLDLAQAIRRAGWNVLTFHYRGNWGSAGDYSFGNVLDDTAAALNFVRTQANVQGSRIDARNIVLIGHSVGGFAALTVGANDPGIRAIASLSGFDVGSFAEQLNANEQFRVAWTRLFQTTPSLRVADADALTRQLISKGQDWQFIRLANALASKAVFLLAATRDTTAPMPQHHVPLMQALRANRANGVTEVVLETDHSYSDKRIAMMRAVVTWLNTQR